MAEKERHSRNTTTENQPLVDAIAKLDGEIAALNIRVPEARHERDDLTEAMEPLKNEFNEIKQQLDQAGAAVENKKGQIANLKNSTDNPLNAYGAQTQSLVNLIQGYPRWNEKPIGPIGQSIILKDPR